MTEPVHLKAKGGRWYHSDDYASPNITKASLGLFFHEVLKSGAYVGEIWPFNHRYDRTGVYVSVFMTPEMKEGIEAKTRFRFRDPPKISLNSAGIRVIEVKEDDNV